MLPLPSLSVDVCSCLLLMPLLCLYCLRPSSIYISVAATRASRARCLTMDAEGAGAEGVAVPLPKTYSRKGKWTVYNSVSPKKQRAPNRVLSKEAQAKREKEYELGTKVG